MNMFRPVFLLSICCLLIVGCGKAEPKCDSSKTIDTVLRIVNKELESRFGPEDAKKMKFSLRNIRTTAMAKNGDCMCSADMDMSGDNGKSVTAPITFKVELIPAKNDIFVTVFGL